jgi:ribosomal protein S18 acetylase RimI-like enzyme
MKPFQIRLAQIEDARAIAAVHINTWQYAYRGQIPDEFLDGMSIERRTARWHEILSRSADLQEHVLVADVDGKIVGFCVVGRSRDEDADETVGELYAIYIDAQTMNHGVGSALLKIGLAYLAEQGYARATLWVMESNQRARRFYERKGWVADGTTRTEAVANTVVAQVRYTIQFLEQQSQPQI